MYVGRFAPSPTGPLHFGSLVAAVASYADARSAGGQWLLRIEDVDATRCTKAAESEILRQLAACGFEHDGEIVRQSERSEIYDASIAALTRAGHVFACTCSRKMLGLARRNSEGEAIYPGTCRSATRSLVAHSQRLRVNDDAAATVQFTDHVRGVITQNVAREVGDFVLKRADGCYTYQLAVVVDDALQGVTHVVRGEDLLLNTPRQIYLQQLLGLATPSYLHVPLVRDKHGEKLSKQTLARPVDLDAPLATLHAVWAFLQQAQIGRLDSVAAFWRRATTAWNPILLRRSL